MLVGLKGLINPRDILRYSPWYIEKYNVANGED
jgi:hypothetical protein